MNFVDRLANGSVIVFGVLGLLLGCTPAGMGAEGNAARAGRLPVIFVCGDSTAKNSGAGKNGSPMVGWGTTIVPFFDPGKVTIENVGHAGRSSMTYYNGDWPTVLPKISAGDYVLLVFGINDGGTPGGMGDETVSAWDGREKHTYGWYMAKMASDAVGKGAHVVLLTVTARNVWTNPKVKFADGTPVGPLPGDYNPADDRIERGTGHGQFTQWTKDVGAKLHLPVFDLTNYCADEYEKMGRENVNKLYSDHNHTYRAGAEIVSEAIVAGLKGIKDSPFVGFLSAKGQAVAAADGKFVSDNLGDTKDDAAAGK